MALNIKATRRVSLEGFGVGWDECYLIVKAVAGKEAKAISAKVSEAEETQDQDKLAAVLENFCNEYILKGRILNTNEEGEEEPYEFGNHEVAEVTEALGLDWQITVLSVATGADRLKSLSN